MAREQILEERCKRLKTALQNIFGSYFQTLVESWFLNGEITYNDYRYLCNLGEVSEKTEHIGAAFARRDIYVSRKNTTRPPLGIMPKDEWDFIRRNVISNAIERYVMAGERIPKEWIYEYNELCKEDITTT